MKIYLTFIALLISKATFASEPCTPMTALINEPLIETNIPLEATNPMINQSDRAPAPYGDMLADVFKSPEQDNESDLQKILADRITFPILELDFDIHGETSSESEKSSESSEEEQKIVFKLKRPASEEPKLVLKFKKKKKM